MSDGAGLAVGGRRGTAAAPARMPADELPDPAPVERGFRDGRSFVIGSDSGSGGSSDQMSIVTGASGRGSVLGLPASARGSVTGNAPLLNPRRLRSASRFGSVIVAEPLRTTVRHGRLPTQATDGRVLQLTEAIHTENEAKGSYASTGSSHNEPSSKPGVHLRACAWIRQPLLWQERRAWDGLILVLCAIVALAVPYWLAFAGLTNDPKWWQLASMVTIKVAFAVDFVLGFRTAHHNQFGELVLAPLDMAVDYLSGWFFVDAVAVAPLVIDLAIAVGVVPVESEAHNMLMVVKCARWLRFADVFPQIDQLQYVHANMWRVLRLLLALMVFSHWSACVWFGVSDFQQPGEDAMPWTYVQAAYEGGPALHYVDSAWEKYTFCLTTGLFLLMGESVNFQTETEHLMAFVILIVGTFLYATVLGLMTVHVQALLTPLMRRSAERLDQVEAIMRKLDLPATMQTRIRDYFDYWYRTHKLQSPIEEKRFLEELSDNLRTELRVWSSRKMINQCWLFDSDKVSSVFMFALIEQLEHKVFMPNDFIVRVGDRKTDAFFINSGLCAVVDETGAEVAQLQSGDMFGEIASLLNMPRTATVIARDWCEMHVLPGSHFEKTLIDFPKEAGMLRAIAVARVQELERIQVSAIAQQAVSMSRGDLARPQVAVDSRDFNLRRELAKQGLDSASDLDSRRMHGVFEHARTLDSADVTGVQPFASLRPELSSVMEADGADSRDSDSTVTKSARSMGNSGLGSGASAVSPIQRSASFGGVSAASTPRKRSILVDRILGIENSILSEVKALEHKVRHQINAILSDLDESGGLDDGSLRRIGSDRSVKSGGDGGSAGSDVDGTPVTRTKRVASTGSQDDHDVIPVTIPELDLADGGPASAAECDGTDSKTNVEETSSGHGSRRSSAGDRPIHGLRDNKKRLVASKSQHFDVALPRSTQHQPTDAVAAIRADNQTMVDAFKEVAGDMAHKNPGSWVERVAEHVTRHAVRRASATAVMDPRATSTTHSLSHDRPTSLPLPTATIPSSPFLGPSDPSEPPLSPVSRARLKHRKKLEEETEREMKQRRRSAETRSATGPHHRRQHSAPGLLSNEEGSSAAALRLMGQMSGAYKGDD